MTPYVTRLEDLVWIPTTYGPSPGAVVKQEVLIAKHPDAPLFGSDDLELLAATFDEGLDVARGLSAAEPGQMDPDDLELLRQTALVNLFVFLKYVAGYSCPYNELKETLHGEMSNARTEALAPGARFFGFVPRSSFKSTVLDHGSAGWELVRNGNLRIGIFSAIEERATDFMHSVQRIFDANDLVAFLWPETKPRSRRNGQWNERTAVMSSRTRTFPEPSVRAHTAAGSTAGIHVDLAVFDDIVSDAELTSTRDGSSEMLRRRGWLPYAISTILISPALSRVVGAATRYAIDDPYEDIMQAASRRLGDWTALGTFYDEPQSGAPLEQPWSVYYRSALVAEESIFPEKYTAAFLRNLAETDFWTYITQYVNNPHSADKVEFSGYEVGHCCLSEYEGELLVTFNDHDERKLSAADVVLAIDPAASEKRVSARTSRSALAVVARFADRRVAILSLRGGYFAPTALYDVIFSTYARFARYVRNSYCEAEGPFKFVAAAIREEEKRRKTFLNMVPMKALGDKLATIRSTLEPLLRDGLLFVCDSERELFMSEFRVFPSASLDLLDATKLAIAKTYVPEDTSAYVDEDDFDLETEYAFRVRA